MEGRHLESSLLKFADHRIELVVEQHKITIAYRSTA